MGFVAQLGLLGMLLQLAIMMAAVWLAVRGARYWPQAWWPIALTSAVPLLAIVVALVAILLAVADSNLAGGMNSAELTAPLKTLALKLIVMTPGTAVALAWIAERRRRTDPAANRASQEAPALAESELETALRANHSLWPKRGRALTALSIGMLGGVVLAGWTVGLFHLLPADPAPALKAFEEKLFSNPASVFVPFTLALMMTSVLYEELVWRCVGQVGAESLLERADIAPREAAIAAAVVMSAGWAFVHTGSIDPYWVKFLQIFPMGLVHAWLMFRYGPIGTVTAHGVHNAAIVLVVLSGSGPPGI